MDESTFSYCLQNERTSGLSCWTAPQRCCNCTQMSGNSNPFKPACTTCSRNYLKCKPWRRKPLLRTTPKWTWLGIYSCLKLLLLLSSLSSTVCHVFSRTISTKRTPMLRLYWMLLIASFLGIISLPLASCQDSLQPTPSVKSPVLPNAVVYVGSAFSYNISENVFDCDVDSIVVSETADRFLSHWLSYNNIKKQLYGVPSDKDEGTYNILVVALTKDVAGSGHVCGSRSFSIVVMPVSEQLPVSVHLGTGGFSRYNHKPAHSLSCAPGTQAILGTVILNIDMQSLNGHERMMLVVKMADHLSVDSSKVSFFSGEISHPMTQQLDSPAVIAAGVGNGRFAKGSRSLLTWNMACGALKLADAGFSRLETAAQDGTISALMGVPVVGWHVMSGTQKDMARRRVRRQVQGIWGNTPTPTVSSAPPSRLSNMSTLVIVSKTVTLTSALSQNSTIGLSSVMPSRTVVTTPSVSANSTLFSQPLTRTIQSSTVSINLTVSSLLPNRTVFSSSSVTVNLTVSSRVLNRTAVPSPSVSFNLTTSTQSFNETVTQSSSIVNLTSQPTSIVSSSKFMSTLTVNSSTIQSPTTVFSANKTTILERPTPSLNSTFVKRTVMSSVPSSAIISSLSFPTTTVVTNSSSITLSLNESMVLSILSSPIVSSLSTRQVVTSSARIPSVSQGNGSSAVASFSVPLSFNRTALVSFPSLLSSASPVLTTFRSTSVTISSSIAQLNSSMPNVTSPTLTIQLTPKMTTVSSSFMTLANTSVTSFVNQTSLSTVRSKASTLSSIPLKSTLSTSVSSSLILLTPNTTLVENVTSSAKTSSFVTSSMVISSSALQLANSTVSNKTSPIPTSSLLISAVVPTISSREISFVKTSSLVLSPLSTFAVMMSSSVIQPSSSSMLPSRSATVDATSVVQPFSSATLQPNLTSPTTPVLSLLMSSPIATSVNLTSLATSLNATTTKRTALVNSTSKIVRSSVVIVTTSEFPLTRTSGTRKFPSTFAADRTVVRSSSEGVDKPSINISSTPKITTTTFLLSPDSSLSNSQFTSVVSSVELRPNFTKLTNSSLVTMSVRLTTSPEVHGNSTIVSSTKESSSALSSPVTILVNSSVSAKRTLLGVNSTAVVSSSSGRFIIDSSLTTTILSGSKPILVSPSIVLANLSSTVAVSKTSVPFSSAVTPVDTSVMNSSRTVMSTPETSLTITSAMFSSSFVTSTLKSQDLTTVFSRSEVIKSSKILQNSSTVFGANRTVSMNSSSLPSTVSSRSTTGINSTRTRISSATVLVTSTMVLPPSVTVLPTSATVTPSFATVTASFATVTPSFPTVTPSFATVIPTSVTVIPSSSSRLVSVFSRIPSSVRPSATVTPTSRPPLNRITSILETSGPLSSRSSLSSSNTTQTVTATEASQTISMSPSSTVVVIPTTAPPNLPPRVINNMGRVIAPAGMALHYTIPDDTFYDREDRANTRNLSLSMTLANGSVIPEDFWLQFDSKSQTINGLPLRAHVPDGIMGEVLVLRAQDSRGAEALDAFEVLVIPSEKPVVQELKIRITNEFVVFNRDVAQRLLLLKKIAAYYEDADESNIRVLSFASGSVIMTWTNDSLPTDRCDEERVQYVANKILSNGEVKSEFRDALQGFPVVSASEERLGVCNGSYPVVTDQPIVPGEQQSQMEDDLWYKHVLVGVLVVLILIVLAVLLIWYYRRRRPKPSNEKRTFKKRKPIILGPEIELKPIPGKPLVLPDDTPSFPPSYISETSLDKPVSFDDEDEEDYGKRSPGVKYEPPPPFYRALADDNPRHSPPPAYQLPPMY